MNTLEPSYFIGRPVESMQTMLRVAYEGNNRLVPVVADGIYGPNTMSAVTAFQRSCGLPATGVMNQATWEKLVRTYQREIILQGAAEPLLAILNPHQVLKIGECNYHVNLVQAILKVLGSVYRGIPQVSVTGSLDGPTVTAVRRFQSICGLRESGEVDKDTWRHLCRQYTMAAGDGNGQVRRREM